MASYAFLTTWVLDAPIQQVFDVLKDSKGYPDWWKGVTSCEVLEPAGADGIGELDRFSWKSVLPYTLTFDIRATRIESPYLIEGEASGELEGVGVWRLYEGRGTAVTYDWRVRTTKRWMNALGPLPRPAFVWNHDLVMRQGGVGLARRLGVPLILND
jgi:hypothetical protein